MANFLNGIISLTLSAVVLSGVFISTVKNTNQSYVCPANISATCTWSAAEIALYGLLTIAGIAGMVYGVLNVFGLA